MTGRSPLVAAVALAVLAGGVWYGALARDERLEALERELAALHQELRASARTCGPTLAAAPAAATPAMLPLGVPPEALAQRVAELVDERSRARARPQATEPAAAPPPLSSEQFSALREAERLVDTATASGVMAPDDVAALRAALLKLGPAEEAWALRQRLIVAGNRGALTLPPGVLSVQF